MYVYVDAEELVQELYEFKTAAHHLTVVVRDRSAIFIFLEVHHKKHTPKRCKHYLQTLHSNT